MSRFHADKFYIDGAWVAPVEARSIDVVNPATEAVIGRVGSARPPTSTAPSGGAARVPTLLARPSREERIALLDRIIDVYQARFDEMAHAIREEMGAPSRIATRPRPAPGIGHFQAALAAEGLPVRGEHRHDADRPRADRRRRHDHAVELAAEPDRLQGRAGARGRLHHGAEADRDRAALGATCFAEILHEAGVPTGVFNLVNGDGPARRRGAVARIPASTWCRSPARRAPASRSRQGGRRHGQARRPGARRQVGQHHSRRRRSRAGRDAAACRR